MLRKILASVCIASAALNAVEPVIHPDKLTFFNVIPAKSPNEADRQAAEILEYVKKSGNDIVLPTVSLSPANERYEERNQCSLQYYRNLKERLKGHNVKVGLFIVTVLGHSAVAEKPGNFQPSIDVNGKRSRFCHLDKNYQQYLYDNVALFAREKPVFILFDDDLRAQLSAAECFCPLHTAEFNRRAGTNYTPDELRKAVKEAAVGDKIYETFLQLQRDSVDAIAKVLRAAIDSVDPTIPAGGCMPGAYYRFAGETAETLGAKGQPRVMRLCNGAYLEPGARIFPEELITTLSLSAAYKNIDILLDEADTYPRSLFSRSSTSMHTKICASIMAGLKGAKLWWINTEGFSMPMPENYMDIISEHRNYYPALFEQVKNSEMSGIIIPVHRHFKTYHPANGKWERFVNSSSWGAAMFGAFGVPYRCAEKLDLEGIYAIAGKETVERFTDEELKQLLSRKLLMDGSAAEAIYQRGLGEYLGVKVDLKKFKASTEISRRTGINYPNRYAPGIPLLTITDPKVEVLTEFCLKQLPDDKPERICPGIVCYDNSLGGRICIAPARLTDIVWLNHDDRKPWLIEALDGLNKKKLPFIVMKNQNFATLTRDGRDGSKLAIVVNLNFDTAKKLVIRCAEPVRKIERLMPDGKWVSLDFQKNGMQYTLPIELNCYANAVIRVLP